LSAPWNPDRGASVIARDTAARATGTRDADAIIGCTTPRYRLDDSRSTHQLPAERPPYRPPIGMPISSEGAWRGAVVSILLHILLVLLLLAPAVVAQKTLFDAETGAGGAGPAGGGGGGTGGTGGRTVEERIQYIDIAPNAIPALLPEVPTTLPEPVIVPPPEPVVTPPPPPPPAAVDPPKVETPPVAVPAPAAPAAASAIPGTGGGSGNDGTAGNGPGSGGGVGSGVGTGRGSGIGPGTGGGDGNIYPPTPTQMLLPPSDPPDRITPYTVIALFDVDEKGRVIKFEFNESKDRDYNKKVKAMLADIRFRPATTLEGVAIRAVARIEFTVY
jgi:periplasmic protein TonB